MEKLVELMQQFGIAFGLMLILEGMLPFMYPQRWRDLVTKLSDINNKQLRISGFTSMLIGLILLSSLT